MDLSVGEYVEALRNKRGLSQRGLAIKAGIKNSTVSRIEKNEVNPDPATLMKLAPALGVSKDALMARCGYIESDIDYIALSQYNSDIIRVPIYGTIPAGIPMEAIEDIEDEEEVPASWSNGGKEYFGLKVKGDSMSPTYLDGDTIIFIKSPVCESGQDCCVMVNGSDSTFKRVFKKTIGITLQPLNPAYEAYFYTNEEIENLPVVILGTVKELRRQIG